MRVVECLRGVLHRAKENSLSTADLNTFMPIAYSTPLASGHAMSILMLNGYKFDPVYYVDRGQPLQYQPFSGSQMEAEKQDIVTVYPNPTSGDLYIYIDSDVMYEENVRFELFDMQGRLIFSDKIENMTYKTDFRREEFSSGVYPYRIITESYVLKTGKLVIE